MGNTNGVSDLKSMINGPAIPQKSNLKVRSVFSKYLMPLLFCLFLSSKANSFCVFGFFFFF